MNSIPEIQYAKAGEVLLAYQILGAGEQTLLLVNGFVSHLECIWEEPGLKDFLLKLAKHYRLVLFDKRGVGQLAGYAVRHAGYRCPPRIIPRACPHVDTAPHAWIDRLTHPTTGYTFVNRRHPV